jgi:hypothetical protein
MNVRDACLRALFGDDAVDALAEEDRVELVLNVVYDLGGRTVVPSTMAAQDYDEQIRLIARALNVDESGAPGACARVLRLLQRTVTRVPEPRPRDVHRLEN